MPIVVAMCGWDPRGWCLVAVLTAVTLVLLSATKPAVSAVPPRVQVGLASWRTARAPGNETASGEIFNQREMVAAHRPLPSEAWCA